uniref:Im:7136021 n=1 Tax=Oncorhynchus kisutch TaxID=8019 RepID=A0A8C7FSF1_ONCKI
MAFRTVGAAQLPSEVWVHVFGYLSTTDKLNIRSCCKYFKKMVDHWSLWKGNTVVLKKLCAYTSQFWTTLRRRKISSVVVQKASLKEWKQLALSLPWLTTIAVEHCFDVKAFEILKQFHNLKRLAIRRCRCGQGLSDAIVPLQQVTHFSVCEMHCAPRSDIVSAVSKLSHLTSLLYHEGNHPIPRQIFHLMLNRLPHLKHLSLKMGTQHGSLPDDYFNIYKTNGFPEGHPVSAYAHSIPNTVTSLTLQRVMVEQKDMKALGKQASGLLYLHFDPCSYNSSSSIGEIPKLFPQLMTLKMRHYNVPEKEFLSLQQLKHLEQLEILDAHSPSPHLLQLIHKLQVLTNHRTQIIHSLGPRDPTTCYCTHY